MDTGLSKLRSFASRRSLLAAGSAILAAATAMATPSAHAQTLDAATFRALLDSPKLKADQARQGATREELTAARAALLPSVSVNFDWTLGGTVTTWPTTHPPIPALPGSVGAT